MTRLMMMPAPALAILLALLATPAAAQSVVDGDTFDLNGERIRLWGIDAPEADEICVVDGQPARIGRLAGDTLAGLMSGAQVRCSPEYQDRYGRTVARCTADGADLASMMVQIGMAWDWPRYSDGRYAAEQAAAEAAGNGVWGWGCEWGRAG